MRFFMVRCKVASSWYRIVGGSSRCERASCSTGWLSFKGEIFGDDRRKLEPWLRNMNWPTSNGSCCSSEVLQQVEDAEHSPDAGHPRYSVGINVWACASFFKASTNSHCHTQYNERGQTRGDAAIAVSQERCSSDVLDSFAAASRRLNFYYDYSQFLMFFCYLQAQ